MAFFVEIETDTAFPGIDCEELFNRVALQALEYTDCPYDCEVSLSITDDASIRELNREFRDIDKPTDVLSFPFLEFEAPGGFDTAVKSSPDCFNPDTGELMLGDIMISADRVKSQAEEYGHSVKRELAFLIAHSMLHLQGFDHMNPEDAALMEKAQDEILERLEIRS